ncbi:MAG: hypothetical protein Q7K65_03065 [Candidatus Buchananbacteria bacterium]|nr:hypothetical protein [Candidatus Buchananbacteria bacterium]
MIAKNVRVILNGDKLRTIKEINLDGRLIPYGTIYYAFSFTVIKGMPMPLYPISGFGDNLAIEIVVTRQKTNVKSWMHLPIDCLKLTE